MHSITRRTALGAPLLAAAAATVPAPAWATYAAPANIIRWDGTDRYQVSARASNEFSPGIARLFVASGVDFPDALSGAGIAGKEQEPILLSPPDKMSRFVVEAIERLEPKDIVIFGGESAISSAVAGELEKLTTGSVTRWSGANRYETAAAVSRIGFASGADTVFVASGERYPDALAVAPVAGRTPGPILLTRSDHIPGVIETELRRLAPSKIVVVGGESVINTAVEDALFAICSNLVRWAGPDRFATAARISSQAFPSGARRVYVASGLTFADALSGGPVAAMRRAPMLLVEKSRIPPVVATELKRLRASTAVLVGGRDAVDDNVFSDLYQYLV